MDPQGKSLYEERVHELSWLERRQSRHSLRDIDRRARRERSHGYQCGADHSVGARSARVRALTANMPAFGAAYSDYEIASVANYVTARFGTQASALTAERVAKLRSTD
jgi:hypothetical protein